MNKYRYLSYFTIGGVGYGVVEILWRGRTHWTMIIAGGLCLCMFFEISRLCRKQSRFLKAVLCALGVTTVEFIFGVVFNLALNMKVWDYSHQPFNLLGQICPAYSLAWLAIALAALPIIEWVNSKMEQRAIEKSKPLC